MNLPDLVIVYPTIKFKEYLDRILMLSFFVSLLLNVIHLQFI